MSGNDEQMALFEFEDDRDDVARTQEGQPRYFDAALLPDAPGYQPVASGSQMCMIYLLFPEQQQMLEMMEILTFGQRKRTSVRHDTKYVTIECVHPGKNGEGSFADRWKRVFEKMKVVEATLQHVDRE